MVLSGVDSCITKEDEDNFDAGYYVMFNARLLVEFCVAIIVNVHVVGCVSITRGSRLTMTPKTFAPKSFFLHGTCPNRCLYA